MNSFFLGLGLFLVVIGGLVYLMDKTQNGAYAFLLGWIIVWLTWGRVP